MHLAQSRPAPHPTQVQDFTGVRPDEARGGCAPGGHGHSRPSGPGRERLRDGPPGAGRGAEAGRTGLVRTRQPRPETEQVTEFQLHPGTRNMPLVPEMFLMSDNIDSSF